MKIEGVFYMEIIIDRFEGEYAVAEYTDGQGGERFANIARVLLPGAKAGDVVRIAIDKEATDEREKKINTLMEELFED